MPALPTGQKPVHFCPTLHRPFAAWRPPFCLKRRKDRLSCRNRLINTNITRNISTDRKTAPNNRSKTTVTTKHCCSCGHLTLLSQTQMRPINQGRRTLAILRPVPSSTTPPQTIHIFTMAIQSNQLFHLEWIPIADRVKQVLIPNRREATSLVVLICPLPPSPPYRLPPFPARHLQRSLRMRPLPVSPINSAAVEMR